MTNFITFIKQKIFVVTGVTVFFIVIVFLIVQSPAVSKNETGEDVALPTPAQRPVVTVEGLDAIDDLTDIVYNPQKEVFYVSSFDEGIVYIVGVKSKRIDAQVNVDFTHKLFLDEQAQVLYVSAGDNRVVKVNVDTFTEEARVYVNRKPSGMVLDKSSGYLYVTTEFGNTVDVVDTSTMSVVTSISVGKGPTDVAIGRSGQFVFVIEREDASIGVISTQTQRYIKNVTFTGRPHRIYSTAENDVLLILDQYTNSLVVFDESTQSIAKSIPIIPFPSDLVIDSVNKNVYVTSFSDNTVAVIDFESEQVEEIISLSSTAFSFTAGLNNIHMVPGSSEVLVSNTNTGELHFVSVR